MTLTLVDPSPAAVIQHPGGMISARCADYLGGVRGTLTTVSDPLSAAGTVVKEEQTIAVPTTFTTVSSRWNSVSNTILIPLGDLDRLPNVRYLVWLSIRMTGEPPTNARAHSTWLTYDIANGGGLGVGMGIGTFYADFDWMPNHRVSNYILTTFSNQAIFESETDAENFIIRAWGIAGGDVAFYLDTVYFVPIFENTAANYIGSPVFPGNGILRLFTNGQLFRNNDLDPTGLPFGSGHHSVLTFEDAIWVPDEQNWGQIAEFQTSDEEVSSKNIAGGGDLFSYPGIKSFLFIPVGATDVPPLTLVEDDFSVDQFDRATETVKDIGIEYLRFVSQGTASGVLFFWDSPTNQRRGTFVEAGSGKATTYFGASIGQSSSYPCHGGGTGYWGEVRWGGDKLEGGFSSSESSSDPRNFDHRVFHSHLEHFVASVRTSMIDLVGNADTIIGMMTGGVLDECGAVLKFDSSGNVTLLLSLREGSLTNTVNTFAGPVTVGTGYTLGDWWWIKVEKRGYWWRAKAWEDGTSEPSSWTVEAGQPWPKSSTGQAYIPYPWENNWPLSVDNDNEIGDPRGGLQGIANEGSLFVKHEALANQARLRLEMDDFSAYWAPDSNSPGDINLSIKKYDESPIHGAVSIPFGAHRFVRSSLALHHFNNDNDGIDIHLWKDAGTRDFMPAGISRIFRWLPLNIDNIAVYEFVPLT